MGKNIYINGEGYHDQTAGHALRNIIKEEHNKERVQSMAKRNCRRTVDESRIHDKAVKMRKMTDEQLVHYFEDRIEKARREGFNQGKAQAPKQQMNVQEIIEKIGNVRGIGSVKLDAIKTILVQNLEA